MKFLPTNETTETPKDYQELNIINEIREICDEINKTDVWFQFEMDMNLIEACIYKRKMLIAKYEYLLSKTKERECYEQNIVDY